MVTPRGRNRKPRMTRMDAAIDAMKPLGFTSTLVRKRVNHLLSVYGGDDSWKFIEEDAYKVLIESFLDEQEETMSLACVEDKKDDSLNEEGEMVPCSLGGEETITEENVEGVVPLQKSYGFLRCEGDDDDDSDDDGDELLYFEPATKDSDILFPKTGEGISGTILVGERRNHTRARPLQESGVTGGSSSQRGNLQLDKGKGPFQSSNGNGSEMGSSSALNSSSNNNHGNIRPKRQLVRLVSDPYASHK